MWIKIGEVLINVDSIAQIRVQCANFGENEGSYTISAKFKNNGDWSILFTCDDKDEAIKVLDKIAEKLHGVVEIDTE